MPSVCMDHHYVHSRPCRDDVGCRLRRRGQQAEAMLIQPSLVLLFEASHTPPPPLPHLLSSVLLPAMPACMPLHMANACRAASLPAWIRSRQEAKVPLEARLLSGFVGMSSAPYRCALSCLTARYAAM